MQWKGVVTVRTLDAVLRNRSEGAWATPALELPAARVVAVLDSRGTSIPFEIHDGTVVVDKRSSASLLARIELPEDLVTASALEQLKLNLERAKVESAERLSRRTLLVSVATAVVSAGATIGVAAISNFSSKPDKPQPASYRDLDECREGLNQLKTLAALDQ